MPKPLDFDGEIAEKRKITNQTLSTFLNEQNQIESGLKQALEYTLHSEGKRIRAALVLWCCEVICGEINDDAKIAAAAVEMVHTYSLIHDDLPAMDDDDMRRGQETCHKKFDEATALLAGDALLTLSFEILAEKVTTPQIATEMIKVLAAAAGPAGMIAGQMADLKAENKKGSQQMLEYIHKNKTAKMFSCAAALGALAAKASPTQLGSLAEYGLKIGLGFQVADDILDVTANSKDIGKTAGKDTASGKLTFPALIGIEESKKLEKQLADEAIDTLKHFGDKAEILKALANALVARTR